MSAERTRVHEILFICAAMAVLALLVEIEMRLLERFRPAWFQINVGDPADLSTDARLLFSANLGGQEHADVDERVNELGWRGPTISREKKAGIYRIMFLGDSAVWSAHVQESSAFPWLTASLLQQRLGRPFETVNAASSGYSSTQSRIVFEDNVDWVKPDAVVIGCVWSDVVMRRWTDEEMLRRFSSEGYRFENRLRLFLRHSAAARWIEARIIEARRMPENRRDALLAMVNINIRQTRGGEARVSTKQHLANLRSIANECRRRGILPVLLILPIDRRQLPWPEARLRPYHDNFRKVAAEYGSLLVDAYSLFPRDPGSQSALFIETVHLSVQGHDRLAATLADAMAKRLTNGDAL